MSLLLLDTHAFLWAVRDPALLSDPASGALQDPGNDLLVSAVTAFELAQKHRTGRMPEVADVLASYASAVATLGARPLPLDDRHALEAGSLPWPHRDPFDRLLVAQARVEGAVLVTKDRVLRHEPPDGLVTLW